MSSGNNSPPPTHDLLRLREPGALCADCSVPSWVGPALQRAPWAVVRRGYVREGVVPVGVRGTTRAHRFAAFVALADIAERVSPEDLAGKLEKAATEGTECTEKIERYRIVGKQGPFQFSVGSVTSVAPRSCTMTARAAGKNADEMPARAALARVAPLLSHRGYRWGPGGSIGFELATGVPTATWSSDLDLVVRRDCWLEAKEAARLLALLAEAAAPAQVDVIVETPAGGVLLADLARAPMQVLLRTPDGPRLSADPWASMADQLH